MHVVGCAFAQRLVTHTPCFNTKKANTQHTGVAPNTCEQEQHATRNITHMRDPGEGLRNMEIVASGACVPHSLFIEKRGISFHSVYAISSGQRHSVFVWISHGPRLIWATTKCKLISHGPIWFMTSDVSSKINYFQQAASWWAHSFTSLEIKVEHLMLNFDFQRWECECATVDKTKNYQELVGMGRS